MATLGRNLICKIFYDLLLCICTFLPYLVTNFGLYPYRRGFFCGDESIRYPVRPSTVSSTELYLVSVILVIVIVIATEYYRLPPMVRGQQALQQYLLTLYHVFILFAFGGMASVSITSVAKFTVGRLRPHFIALCRPNITCQGRSPIDYIEDYTCTYENADARMSFFSGHSSWAAYAAIFVTMYLQSRLRSPKLVLLKSLVQSLTFYLAAYTALTRISDYKHHPSDVATGLVFGALTAYCTIKWASDDLKLTTWGCLTQRQNSEDNALLQENNRTSYSAIQTDEN